MTLPPTSANLFQHVLRAHLQVMLWKAADQLSPPSESVDISKFGWKLKDDIPIPVIAQSEPAPPGLIDVIRCQCKSTVNKCGTEVCGCHKEHLSCTSYCKCCGKEDCCNPYLITGSEGEEADPIETENSEAENVEVDEVDVDSVVSVDVNSLFAEFENIDDEWE